MWGMLYADDAGVVSRSAKGLARIMNIVVEVLREFRLTVSENKTETLFMLVKDKWSPPPPPLQPPPVIEAAGLRYTQAFELEYLGRVVTEHGDLTREINCRSRQARACIRRFDPELFDRPGAPFRNTIRLLQAEVMEALLYGCTT